MYCCANSKLPKAWWHAGSLQHCLGSFSYHLVCVFGNTILLGCLWCHKLMVHPFLSYQVGEAGWTEFLPAIRACCLKNPMVVCWDKCMKDFEAGKSFILLVKKIYSFVAHIVINDEEMVEVALYWPGFHGACKFYVDKGRGFSLPVGCGWELAPWWFPQQTALTCGEDTFLGWVNVLGQSL